MPKLKVKIDPYAVLNDAIEYAVEAGMNKHDKYSETPLSEASRSLLLRHIENYFWVYTEENGIEWEEAK